MLRTYSFKVTRAWFGHEHGKTSKLSLSLNNCVIEHKQQVPYVLGLEKMCTYQDISIIQFIMRGNHFFCPRTPKGFTYVPHITCMFHLLKYVVIFLVSAILHHISLLRRLPKSYFKISTIQLNFLCSSFVKFLVESYKM